MPLSILGLVMVGFSAAALAWNPYDTDSGHAEAPGSWSSSPGNYLAPGEPQQWSNRGQLDQSTSTGDWDSRSRWYLPEPETNARWGGEPGDAFAPDPYADPNDWSERERWQNRSERNDSESYDRHQQDAYRSPEDRDIYRSYADEGHQRRSRAEESWRSRSLYDDFRPDASASSSGQWEQPAPRDRRETRLPSWDSAGGRTGAVTAHDRFNGYRFRPDPDLSASREGRQDGWKFRPLTGREQERSRSEGLYPRIDERDYIQRGPWRSYQDEGTAFGYHAEGRGSGDKYYRGR